MKLFLLALLVAAAASLPVPDEDGNIDVIVNGVPEGEALDIAHLVHIQAQEKVAGEVVATSDVLHPYTAVGIVEAAVAAAADAQAAAEIPAVPEPVVLPEPVSPEVDPEPVAPVVVPEVPVITPPVVPETPVVVPEIPVVVPETPVVVPESPTVLPEAPVVVPEAPVVVPESPLVVPEAPIAPETPVAPVSPPETPTEIIEPVPESAPQTGDLFNNGLVSMVVNTENPSLLTTLQNWLSMVVTYVTNNGATTQTTQVV